MRRRRLLNAIAAAMLASACGGEGDDTSATTTTTTTGETTTTTTTAGETSSTTSEDPQAALEAACACLDASPNAPFPAACGPTLCTLAEDDPATLTCGLTALRDRTPGYLFWSEAKTDHAILILADGRGIRQRSTETMGFATCYQIAAATHGALETAAYYDACLVSDPAVRWACVTDPLWPVEMPPTCVNGWEWSPEGIECF
ncbi:MAG: hypothetical protein H6711_27785 [Myxococcales bacterium]|nr:hypothetical protein [Myxococcales bacterium]